MILVTDIEWVLDSDEYDFDENDTYEDICHDLGLPLEVEIDESHFADENGNYDYSDVANYLNDEFDGLAESFNVVKDYDVD